MAMSHSVELRVPFLDLELFALLERMPSRFKISPMGERKWLYRRAVTPLLPPALQSSMGGIGGGMGRKLGFTTPVDEWLGLAGRPVRRSRTCWGRNPLLPRIPAAGIASSPC
jgi:asparagine synthase (glutamine-hydrolysing)